jgi:hypothetical protein
MIKPVPSVDGAAGDDGVGGVDVGIVPARKMRSPLVSS